MIDEPVSEWMTNRSLTISLLSHLRRPLVYVRETTTRDFSQQSHLPVINENCPACFEQPKERDRVKKLLAQEEAMIPALFFNLKRALVPLLADETYEVMSGVAAAAEARGRNPMHRLPKEKKAKGVTDGQGPGSGPGPGLFGVQSHLTNGKSRARDEQGLVHDVVASGGSAVDTGAAGGAGAVNMTSDANNDNDNEDEDEEGDYQAAKKAKYDGNADQQNSSCVDGYCAPCYELA